MKALNWIMARPGLILTIVFVIMTRAIIAVVVGGTDPVDTPF